MEELESLNPTTGKAPQTRVKDAKSLNAVVQKILIDDADSAKHRIAVQRMLDGEPPYQQQFLRDSGQEGRCNLNFGDGKSRIKDEMAGYYDLTDSVPVLATILPDVPNADIMERTKWGEVMSEEWHRTLKDWPDFDRVHQLLVQKICSHGIGVLYHEDDEDWHWEAAGLDEFKFPRLAPLSEMKIPVAVCFRDVEVGEVYQWIQKLPKGDKRWNEKEVQKAILGVGSAAQNMAHEWEKWQAMAKNNDLFASASSGVVKIAHVWVKEFSGKVSQYITLRDGSNQDFLFKVQNRFDNVNQCFTLFPYEIGSNGFLHSVRGQGYEIYSQVQVLNSLRCQLVDNAKLSGSLLLQPKTADDAENLAILFYAGAAYLPPNCEVQNGNLNNPSQSILPVIQDMTMLMRRNTSDVPTSKPETQRDKTKFEVQAELTRESIIPTASLNLFYQPWRRHLQETYRRFISKKVTEDTKGGKEILAYRERCVARGVPKEILTMPAQVEPMRAIGYGSPTNRLLALDEFLQYYGSLDPVGQNNLLRDRFALKVGYAQVDRYVPKIEDNGRLPTDVEIAELQNAAMSGGTPVTVRPNDNHILHLQIHFPNIESDLTQMEGGQGTPELMQVIQIKIDHITQHMQHLKPDKLQGQIVAQLTKEYNNTVERVQASLMHMQREADRAAEEAAQQQPQEGMPSEAEQKLAQNEQAHQQSLKHMEETHNLKMKLESDAAEQRRAQADANEATRLTALAAKRRIAGPTAT